MPNKSTASIKAAFAEAFERRGGADALLKWAENNETEFYRLASKLIPTEITGANGGALQTQSSVTVDVKGAPDDVLRWLAQRPVASD